jgi:Uma2 family endonuclease
MPVRFSYGAEQEAPRRFPSLASTSPANSSMLLAMSGAAPSLRYSFEEYVRFESEATEKHEFVSGLILAMAGGTLEHIACCSACIASLVAQLAGKKYQVFDSNARVRARSGNAYYPDVSVVCGELRRDPGDELSLTNPVVLIEVLSPSTEVYDRTDKLTDYQQIDSVEHVVFVAHAEQRLDVWTRLDGEWKMTSYAAGERAQLPAIECYLDVTELYRNPLA